MQVISTREEIEAAISGQTMCSLFAQAVERWSDRPALHWNRDGEWHSLDWPGYRAQVAALTMALRELGFGPGQFGLVMARNAPEHLIADLAMMHSGGAAVSVYNTLAPDQIAHLANHSQATLAVIEDEGFLEKVLAIRALCPTLRHMVLVRGQPPDGVLAWEALMARGQSLYQGQPTEFEASWRSVGHQDVASLIYTSGTSGPAKGVTYSQSNILWSLESTQRFLPTQREILVSYLPLAHVSQRFATQWRALYGGHEVYLCPDPADLLRYLAKARPTVFLGVPRVWEKLMAGLLTGINAEPDQTRREGAQRALAAAQQVYRLQVEQQPVPSELASAVEAMQPLLGRLRARLGLDRCWLALTGTAPCRPELNSFWAALGLPLYDVWGMSELTGPALAVPFGQHRTSSVGLPLPGVEACLAQDGELLIRGGNVMVGYHREPAQTADTVDAQGWLHTGDLAERGEDGHYRIVDRKKELIITSSGNNISPANLESLARSNPILGHVVAVGDGRNYICALLVLDHEVAPLWARIRGIEGPDGLCQHPALISEARAALAGANTHLSRIEQFKRFTILPGEWSPATEELTPTLKLKRKLINSKYQAVIDAMYADPPGGHPVYLEEA